jgi:hypothetical protein
MSTDIDARSDALAEILEITIVAAIEQGVPPGIAAIAGGQACAAIIGHLLNEPSDEQFSQMLAGWVEAFTADAWEHHRGECKRRSEGRVH